MFFDPEHPGDLAIKVKTVLEDDSLRNRLVEGGFRAVQQKFDWDKLAARYLDRIDQTLSVRRALKAS